MCVFAPPDSGRRDAPAAATTGGGDGDSDVEGSTLKPRVKSEPRVNLAPRGV